jgi:hypothetical protein
MSNIRKHGTTPISQLGGPRPPKIPEQLDASKQPIVKQPRVKVKRPQ